MVGRAFTALIAGLVACLAACQRESPETAAIGATETPRAACELTVGWDPWEPYQYENPAGAVVGLDVEIASLLASDAGCALRFVRGNWLDLLHQLRDGRIGMLLAATRVPERETYAHFSRGYRKESFALFVRRDELQDLAGRDLAGLVSAGKRVGYTDGYYYGKAINGLFADPELGARFVPASMVELNYSRLMEGGIDALLDDPVVASALLRRKGWDDRVARHPFAVGSGEVSLMFSLRAVPEEVVRRFDQALEARTSDGSVRKILERYRD